MIKTTVGEFRAFLAADAADSDKDDGWFEEICFYVDGSDEPLDDDEPIWDPKAKNALPADQEIRMAGGVVVFPSEKNRDSVSIEPLFRRWRKAQTETHVLVTVPNARFAEFETALAAIGGKVVK